MNKRQFFDDLMKLLRENNVSMVVKIDNKENNYIGFEFADSYYCCDMIDAIDTNKTLTFECIEKNDGEVCLNDNFTYFPADNEIDNACCQK